MVESATLGDKKIMNGVRIEPCSQNIKILLARICVCVILLLLKSNLCIYPCVLVRAGVTYAILR